MIPKVIHYCWFGGNQLLPLAQKCIKSWKKYCPDYEIIEWNESNYDYTKNKYMHDAYKNQKWAFVPDYARLDIIFKHGGIYLDTDVELIKSMDGILNVEAFMGFEDDKHVALGLGFGAERENALIREMLDEYEQMSFLNEDGSLNMKPSPQYQTEILLKHGLRQDNTFQSICDVNIYPTEYFCPKDFKTGHLNKTSNTYSIHWFDASWFSDEERTGRSYLRQQEKMRLRREKILKRFGTGFGKLIIFCDERLQLLKEIGVLSFLGICVNKVKKIFSINKKK